MQQEAKLTAAEVVEMIRTELADPGAKESPLMARLERVRDLQRWFRSEPIGGRLVGVKRLLYWFTASAFDRQAKVIEALLDVVDDLIRDNAELRARVRAAARDQRTEPRPEGEKTP